MTPDNVNNPRLIHALEFCRQHQLPKVAEELKFYAATPLSVFAKDSNEETHSNYEPGALGVVQAWTHLLPMRIQGLLLTGIRGPDGAPKTCPAKTVVNYYRFSVIRLDIVQPFGRASAPQEAFKSLLAEHDEHQHHWLMHMVHCAEVLGYCHPDYPIRMFWNSFYVMFCHGLHMMPEGKQGLLKRLMDRGPHALPFVAQERRVDILDCLRPDDY